MSVIVPVHNRAHLIARSVGSLIHQSYPNLDIILADDCSTDDLEGAVAALDDPRVRILRREKNGGASAARNMGVAAARGSLIAFHDSDDIAVGHKIETQVRALQALDESHIGVYTAVLSYSDGDITDYGDMQVRIFPPPGTAPLSGDMHARTIAGNVMNLPTMLLRKTAVQAAGGFDERLGNNNDWDFTLRLTRLGKFHFLPEPLYMVPEPPRAERSGKISRSARKSVRSFAIITGKLRRAGVRSPELAAHYVTTASFCMRLGRWRFARRYLSAALAIRPAAPRIWARFLLSHMPELYRKAETWRHRGESPLFRPAWRYRTMNDLTVNRFRKARGRLLRRQIERMADHLGRDLRILDVGGRADYWDNVGLARISHIDLLNYDAGEFDRNASADIFSNILGDACDLKDFADKSVDFVHSNSVIEHVGNWTAMERMAGELRRVGRAGWVQTPAWEFPVEPHFRAPFLHWFGAPLARRMLSLSSRYRGCDVAERRYHIDRINLLSKREVETLFPDTDIHVERLILAKSYCVRWMPEGVSTV